MHGFERSRRAFDVKCELLRRGGQRRLITAGKGLAVACFRELSSQIPRLYLHEERGAVSADESIDRAGLHVEEDQPESLW
jgi:hypothetical protein